MTILIYISYFKDGKLEAQHDGLPLVDPPLGEFDLTTLQVGYLGGIMAFAKSIMCNGLFV